MENWNNLNKFLDLKTQDEKVISHLSRQMVDFSIQNNKNEIINLLKEGASVNCYEDGITPLLACLDNGNLLLAEYLLKVGAKISFMPNSKQNDAFWHALRGKKYDFLSLFVNWKCPITEDVIADPPKPALIFATIESDLKAVETLLSHYLVKKRVNERDGFGNTALHYNLSKITPNNEDIEIGKLLLACGADSNARNLEGQSPKELVTDFGLRSVLMKDELEQTLPINDEPSFDNDEEDTPSPTKRMKI